MRPIRYRCKCLIPPWKDICHGCSTSMAQGWPEDQP